MTPLNERLESILKRCEAAPTGPYVFHEYNKGWVNICTDLPLVVKALQKAVIQLERISNFQPWDTSKNPGCGSSEYSMSGYKSTIAEQTLAEIEALLGEKK